MTSIFRALIEAITKSPQPTQVERRNCESLVASIAPVLNWENIDIDDFSDAFFQRQSEISLVDRTNGNAGSFALQRVDQRFQVVCLRPDDLTSDAAIRHQTMNRTLSALHLLKVPSR